MTWKFLGEAIRNFDIIAVQECMDDMDGLLRLMKELEGFKFISSDKTGVFPGDNGLAERLVFIYRIATVELGEVISDITYDRSKVSQLIHDNMDSLIEAKEKYDRALTDYERKRRRTKPKFDLPIFLSFIRQPFCSSFKAGIGYEDYEPYCFMAINAHLIFGSKKDRWREFEALMTWIKGRVENRDKMYYPSFILLGDLNLDFDDPDKDIKKMENLMKKLDVESMKEVHVNFPFLDPHPTESEHFTSNIRLSQRYDQIGLFFHDNDGLGKGFPTHKENKSCGQDKQGPDYGVFNFTELFANALTGESFSMKSSVKQRVFARRYEHEVSDHMPIWLRLKLKKRTSSSS